MKVITKVENIDKEIWDNYVQQHAFGDIFNTYQYYLVLENTKGIKPLLIAIIDDYDSIVGIAVGEISKEDWDIVGITKRLVFYSEPIYNDPNILNLILTYMVENIRVLFIQIRPKRVYPDSIISIYINNGFWKEDHLNSELELVSVNNNWELLQSDKKRGIKQAKNKYYLEISEQSDDESIKIFYRILKTFYKEINHPLKSIDYFKNFIQNFNVDNVRIVFVKFNNQPIAVQFALFYKNIVYALYTASVKEHKDKHAGDMIIWHLIETGVTNGYKCIDLGGGGDPNIYYGPREYKKRFGTTFNNVGRFIYSNSYFYSIAKKVYLFFLKKK